MQASRRFLRLRARARARGERVGGWGVGANARARRAVGCAQDVLDVLLANGARRERGESSLHEEDAGARPEEEEGVVLRRVVGNGLRVGVGKLHNDQSQK